MIHKLNLNLTSSTPSSSPTKTNRSSASNSPKGFEKGQTTFNKPEFLYLNGDESDLTFSPRIMNKQYSSTVQFYDNKLRIKANKCTLEDFIAWKGNYQKIEMDQTIIQYLFPSLQGSQGDKDSLLFINSPDLAKKIVKSYELILDYYGLKLENEQNGELAPADNYNERLEQTLFKTISKNVHAYRIKRVLNFLSKTGFLVYCHKFISFMKVLIKGNDSLIKKAYIGQQERIDLKKVPVPILAHLNDVYESDWKKYDELDLNNEMQQKMLKNQSIFFKSSKYSKSVLLTAREETENKPQNEQNTQNQQNRKQKDSA